MLSNTIIFVFLTEQWKLLGQEKDGSILVGWIEELEKNDICTLCTVVACYNQNNNKLQVRYTEKYFLFM